MTPASSWAGRTTLSNGRAVRAPPLAVSRGRWCGLAESASARHSSVAARAAPRPARERRPPTRAGRRPYAWNSGRTSEQRVKRSVIGSGAAGQIRAGRLEVGGHDPPPGRDALVEQLLHHSVSLRRQVVVEPHDVGLVVAWRRTAGRQGGRRPSSPGAPRDSDRPDAGARPRWRRASPAGPGRSRPGGRSCGS